MALTAYDLVKMKNRELVQHFKTLEAPEFEEMNGEFHGRTLNFGGGFWSRLFVWVMLNKRGDWLAKAFSTTEKNQGEGYNVYRNGKAGIAHDDRLKITMRPSVFDSRDAFFVDYTPYDPKQSYVDEIRKVCDGLYLGFALDDSAKNPMKRLFPFILEGPVADYKLI